MSVLFLDPDRSWLCLSLALGRIPQVRACSPWLRVLFSLLGPQHWYQSSPVSDTLPACLCLLWFWPCHCLTTQLSSSLLNNLWVTVVHLSLLITWQVWVELSLKFMADHFVGSVPLNFWHLGREVEVIFCIGCLSKHLSNLLSTWINC